MVLAVAFVCWSAFSERISSRFFPLCTNPTFVVVIKDFSSSFIKVSASICSWLLFVIIPTITTGFFPFACTYSLSHLSVKDWLIISSAVRRLSVLFQLPLISGVSAGSILETLWLQDARPKNNASVKIVNIDFIIVDLRCKKNCSLKN